MKYRILTGGMGAGVSDWRLAKAVGKCGQIGTISGTALDIILTRRLQMGDKDGNMRRALSAFPIQSVAKRIIDEYYIEGGKADSASFKMVPMYTVTPSKELMELAQGIQIGTLFAMCKESGFIESIKKSILDFMPDVFTDPKASPTGFPFKVVKIEETLAMLETYLKRPRICNLGYLRAVYKKADGSLGYRCAAEPIKAYIKKGGKEEDTEGRKCLCNALLANIGLPEVYKNGYVEQTLITAGDTLKKVREFIKEGSELSVADIIEALMRDISPSKA